MEKPSTSENRSVLRNSMNPALYVACLCICCVRSFSCMVNLAISAINDLLCTQMCPLIFYNHRSIITAKSQVEVFRRQLELAKELERPVSVHCVRAFGDLLEILK